jgi:hypothetical protein
MASFLDRIKDWVTGVENEKLDIEGVDLPEVPRKSSLDLGADAVLDALELGGPSDEEIVTAITPKVKKEDQEIVQPKGEDIIPTSKPLVKKENIKKEVESELSDDTKLPILPGTYETTDQSTQEDAPKLSPQEALLEELRKQKTEFSEKLEESQKKDRRLAMLETVLPFFQQYVQGTTGTKSGLPTVAKPIKMDLDPFKTSKDVMRERKTSIEDLLSEYKLSKQIDVTDPDSDRSKRDRQVLSQLLGKKIPDNFTSSDVDKYANSLFKMSLAEAKAVSDRLKYSKTQDRRSKDQEMRFNKNIVDVINKFENDKVTKALKDQNLAFDKVDNLLDMMKSGNEAVLSPLGISMAKAMGEVGVMTDKDVVRYIKTNGVADEVKDFFSKKSAGVLTEKTQKNLKDIAGIFKILARNKINKTRDKYINIAYRNYGKTMDLSRDEVAYRFGQETDMLSSKQELNQKDQQALSKAKENPESEISKKVIKHLEGKYGRQF